MKIKLFILTVMITFLTMGRALAYEGMNHDEHMETLKNTQSETVLESKAVEIGNAICPVSGNKVNDEKMGEPVQYEYNGKIYNLCCSMCVKDFKKDPERYSKIAEKEVHKNKAEGYSIPEKKHR